MQKRNCHESAYSIIARCIRGVSLCVKPDRRVCCCSWRCGILLRNYAVIHEPQGADAARETFGR
jgi:hypothetical protein